MTTDHPIQGLMKTAMENIRTMIDINTIIGNPIHTPSGQVIIPVSKVGFGFAAGGSEFTGRLTTNTKHKHTKHDKENEHSHTDCCGTASIEKATPKHPFGGGSGGGVSVSPIGFIVVDGTNIKFLPIDGQHQIYERLFEVVPDFLQKLMGKKKKNNDAHPDSKSYVRPAEYGTTL